MKKRILSILTIIMMLVSMFPGSAENIDETVYMDETIHVHEEGEVCTCDEHQHEHDIREECAVCTCSDCTDCSCNPCECEGTSAEIGENEPVSQIPEEEIPEQQEEIPVSGQPEEEPEQVEELPEEGQNEETPVITEETEEQEEVPVSGQPEEEPEQVEELPEEQNEETPVITEETEEQEEVPASGQPEEEPEQVEELPEEQNEETPVITEETEEQEEDPVVEQPEEDPEQAEELPAEEAFTAFAAAPMMMLMSAPPEECSHPEASCTYMPVDSDFHSVYCTECDTDMGNFGHNWVTDQDLGDGTHSIKCRDCGYPADWYSSHINRCNDPGVCSECGAALPDDYPVNHSLQLVDNGDGTHTITCTECSYIVENEAHYTYCDSEDKHVCAGCGERFEDELPIRHMSLYWRADDNEHYQCCWSCGTEIEGTRGEHNIDTSSWETDQYNHYHTCTVCNLPMDSQPHVNCQGGDTCLVCGASGDGIQISDMHHCHNVYLDEEHHVQVCEYCEKQFNVNQHRVSCTDPGACLDCGASTDQMTEPYTDHQYSGKYTECDDGLHHVMVCDLCGTADTYKYDHVVSCKDPTVCTVCGATGLTGFETGAQHDLRAIDNKDGTHTWKCDSCDYVGQTENHYCNCSEPDADHCYACEAALTGEAEVRHINSDYQSDETGHWQYCWSCEKEVEGSREDHNISEEIEYNQDGHGYRCTVCGYSECWYSHVNCAGGTTCLVCGCEDPNYLDTNHEPILQDEDTCQWAYFTPDTDPAKHYWKCKYCDTLYEGQFHNVDEETGKCWECGAEVKFCENEEDHRWVWTSNMSEHYHVCELCSKTKGDWSDHHDCNKDGICDVCGCNLVEGNNLWKEDHDYQLVSDETNHWTACIYCGELAEDSVTESHSFQQASDGEKHWQECEYCGYTTNEGKHVEASEWSMDPDGIAHWKSCEVCGERIDSTWEEHTAQWKVNEDTHQKSCSVCGYASSEIEHEFSKIIDIDDEYHTLVCECGKEKEEAHQNICWFEDDPENGKSYHYTQCEICDMQWTPVEGELHENLPMTYDAEGHHQYCPVDNCDWNMWSGSSHIRSCNGTPGVCEDPDCTYTGPIDDSAMGIMHPFDYTAAGAYSHTGKCPYCGVEILEPHWDYDEDGVCDGCGYGETDGEDILKCILHTATQMEYNENNHWYICTICGEYFDWSSHGSCSGKDTCDLCGMHRDECADFIADHCYVTSAVHDERYHYVSCAFCGRIEKWEHYENCNNPGVCGDPDCGATAAEGAIFTSVMHDYGQSDVQYDEYSHWYICRNCGQVVNKDAHWSENGFNCYNCGIKMSEAKICEEHDLDYDNVQSNEWEHYYVCKICGAYVDWEIHYNCDPDADECALCGRAKNGCSQFSTEHVWNDEEIPVNYDAYSHARTCTLCGELVCLESHCMNWDDETQTYYCEVCGATDLELHACQFDGWKTNSNGLYHYRECVLCHNRWNYETHVDENGDGICDVCELKATICKHENAYFPFWSSDGKTYAHSVECKYCHEWYGEEPHVDANGDHVCDLCGETNIATCNNHVWAKDENGKYCYSSDEETHYVYCEKCRAKGTVTEHIWSDWIASPDGHMRTCKACGYQQWEMHCLCGGNSCKVCGQSKADCTSYMDHWYDSVDTGSDKTHQNVCRYCGDKYEISHGRSCTEPEGVCSGCGRVMDDSLMEIWHMTNGQYESDGFYHWNVCLYCGEQVYKTAHWDYNEDGFCDDTSCGAEITPCPGHNFSDWVADGAWSHKRTCSVCGTVEYENHYNCAGGDTCLACGIKKASDVYLETYHRVEDYEKYESDAYYHWNVCSRCGAAENKTTHWDYDYDGKCDACGNIIGHDHSWTLTKTEPATCTAEGRYIYTCACGMTREDSIEKLDHQYQLTGTTEATCVVPGTKIYTCSGCGASYSETVPGLKDHTWVVTETHPSTCTQEGSRLYTCDVCKATRTEQIAMAAHPWVETDRLDPTCTEDGYADYECAACGATRHDVLNALGHSYSGFTSRRNGTHSRVCSVCNEVQTENCQWTTVEIGDITVSTCNICRFVKTTITGLEELNALGETVTAVAKEINTDNVKIDMDLSAFVVPGLDPEDPDQTPVETHLTITESSEALPVDCSVVKMFNINLEVNGEALGKVDQKVTLSLPLSELSDMSEIEKDTENYKLFVLGENGELIAVEYEIRDGMLILSTEAFGMFVMMTAEEAALLTK